MPLQDAFELRRLGRPAAAATAVFTAAVVVVVVVIDAAVVEGVEGFTGLRGRQDLITLAKSIRKDTYSFKAF